MAGIVNSAIGGGYDPNDPASMKATLALSGSNASGRFDMTKVDPQNLVYGSQGNLRKAQSMAAQAHANPGADPNNPDSVKSFATQFYQMTPRQQAASLQSNPSMQAQMVNSGLLTGSQINSLLGGNGSWNDPNWSPGDTTLSADQTTPWKMPAYTAPQGHVAGSGPGGGTGLGARLTSDQSNNVGGEPIAGLTSGMYGNAAVDANGNMVKGANPTIVQNQGGPNVGYAIRAGSPLPGAPAGTMVGADGKTVTGPDGSTGTVNPNGTVTWNSTTNTNTTNTNTTNNNTTTGGTNTTQPPGNGGPNITTPPGTTPATTAQPTVNNALGAGGLTAGSTPNGNLSQDVNPNETVAGQLKQDLNANNPIIESARARAMQLANARGLQNSSLAAEGGEQAIVNSAMDIAKQDAATYAQQAISNQDVAAKKYVSDTSNATQTNIANLNNATSIQRQNLVDQTELANTGLNTTAQANLQQAGFTHQDAVNLQTLTQTGQQMFSAGLNNLYSLNLNPDDLRTATSNYLSTWTGYPYLPPSTQTFITNAISQLKSGQTPPPPPSS